MPGFDGTGPTGMGPLTGRGFGPCAKGFWGRGLGRGFGRGRGLWGYFGFNQPLKKEDEKKELEAYKKALVEELEDIDKELKNL